MAKKASTPSFIVTLPLKVTADDERLLLDRFLCAKKLNNTLLQVGINIVQRMRSSAEWHAAAAMPNKTAEDKRLKSDAFVSLRKAQRFYKSHFDALVKHHAEAANLHKRIGSHEAQALAEKVFNALNEWVLGKRGRPRFKGHKRPLHSIQDVFGDGRGVVDRDVYSAFLARNCDETTYNPPRLELAWRALENALVQSGLFLPSTSRREGETARLSDTKESIF